MRVLVTNDDGVFAPGIAVLADALAAAGHDVTVVAPHVDWSGMGAALGPVHVDGRVRYDRVTLPELPPGTTAVAVDGPPALAVVCGCLGGFGGRPDAVVAGINAGANVGHAVLHSGTVGAALTALAFGIPAMAVSLDLGHPLAFATAAGVACELLPSVGQARPPVALNVNVPNRPPDDVRGMRRAGLAPAGIVQARVVEQAGDTLQLTLPPGAAPALAPDTDLVLLQEGWVTLTPLRGLAEAGAGAVETTTSTAPLATLGPMAAAI
ncbi:MAG TPA: 5'/3'-nucleotidase SurE [Acidimicrobiales bacterium]|nr:5'/3'-nucleotidase SurE [Acidimicrobiales bacterium]